MSTAASITRRAAIEVAAREAIEVVEGVFALQDVLDANEMLVLSTVKEISPVWRVDDREYAEGPVTSQLAKGFADLVVEELGQVFRNSH